MSTPQTPRAVLLDLLKGVGDGEWSRLHLLYAVDTKVYHPLALNASRALLGREALRVHFEAFSKSGVSLTARDVHLCDAADAETIIARFTYDVASADNDKSVLEACFVWRVRDGLIVESHDYLARPRENPLSD